MTDDLLDRARFVVQLFQECDAIQLPHKPTENVLIGMIARIEAQAAAIDAALAELDASLFTNAEHQRAKDILRATREATK